MSDPSDDDPFEYKPLERRKDNKHINLSLSSQNRLKCKKPPTGISQKSPRKKMKLDSSSTNRTPLKNKKNTNLDFGNRNVNSMKANQQKKSQNIKSTSSSFPQAKETNNNTIARSISSSSEFECSFVRKNGATTTTLTDLIKDEEKINASKLLKEKTVCMESEDLIDLENDSELSSETKASTEFSMNTAAKNLKHIIVPISIDSDESICSTDILDFTPTHNRPLNLERDNEPTSYVKVEEWLQHGDSPNIAPSCASSISENLFQSQTQPDEIKEKSADSVLSNYKTASSDSGVGSSSCVHLHFHVNESPKKFVQSTLNHFFGTNCSKAPASVQITKEENQNHLHVSSNTTNTVEVTNAWKNLMKNVNASKPVENPNRNSYPKKQCPFYKKIEDTNFVVDAFNYGEIPSVTCYFLSHFHYDHYIGLTRSFNKPIYCSQVTANLVKLKIKVDQKYLNVLPLNEPRIIRGVEVTLFEANHCPGAVMFLFCLPSGKSILHVGDFRAHPDMESIQELTEQVPLDVLYLDTTYLDPCHKFPSQKIVLDKCRSLARKHINNSSKEVRFVVGSYTIGKEKVFKEIASEVNAFIYTNTTKEKILNCINDPEISDRLTKDQLAASVHVVNMKTIAKGNIRKYIDPLGENIEWVCVSPTGWNYNENLSPFLNDLKPEKFGNIFSYAIPYSEHSNYAELERFVRFFRPKKIISTVKYDAKVKTILQNWRNL